MLKNKLIIKIMAATLSISLLFGCSDNKVDVNDNKVVENQGEKPAEDTKVDETENKEVVKEEPVSNNQEILNQLEEVVIGRVVDGDTVETSDGRKIRLVGVNTPESTNKTEAYGKEASNFTKEQLTGKTVYLQKDVSDTDRYSRYLRLIWLEVPTSLDDETEIRNKMFNAKLLTDGYAEPYTFAPDVRYSELFRKLGREAREQQVGLWSIDPNNGTTRGDLDTGNGESSNNTGGDTSSSSGESQGKTYYFTPNGKSHHSTKSCRSLAKSKTILEGSLEDAISKGKEDPCNNCVDQ